MPDTIQLSDDELEVIAAKINAAAIDHLTAHVVGIATLEDPDTGESTTLIEQTVRIADLLARIAVSTRDLADALEILVAQSPAP